MKTYASHATALAFGDLKQAALYFDRVVPLFHFSRWDGSDGDLDLKTWVHLLTGKSSVTDDQDSIVQAWRSQTAIESRVEEIADMVMNQTSTLSESVRTVRLQRPNDWESLSEDQRTARSKALLLAFSYVGESPAPEGWENVSRSGWRTTKEIESIRCHSDLSRGLDARFGTGLR